MHLQTNLPHEENNAVEDIYALLMWISHYQVAPSDTSVLLYSISFVCLEQATVYRVCGTWS